MVANVKFSLCLLFGLLASLYPHVSFASWVSVPPEQLISSSHLVVTGCVFKISGNKSKTISVGKKLSKLVYRLAYIRIDQMLKNDLVGISFKPGDTIAIRMGRKKPETSLSFSFKKGESGIWLLNYRNDSFGLYSPDCLMSISELNHVRRMLMELDVSYTAALKNEIPKHERKRKEILSLPPYPQDKIDAAVGNGISSDIDLDTIRVVNTHRNPPEALFLNQSGLVIGGIPYYAQGMKFENGLLSVITNFDKNTGRKHGFVDRNGKLVSKALYSYTEQFSEGRAVVARDNLFGFVDINGKEVIPCAYSQASSFSGGMARVTAGQTVFLIDTMGKVIFQGRYNQILNIGEGWACVNINAKTIGYIDSSGELALDTKGTNYVAEKAFKEDLSEVWIRGTQPIQRGFINRKGKLVFPPKAWIFSNYSEGLVAFLTDYRSHKWGYMDKTGNTVISPRFIRTGDFSEGMAAVTYSCWIERPAVISEDKAIELSPKAHKYFRCSRRGFINKNAEMISPIGFDSTGAFTAGFARVRNYVKGGTFDGIMDKTGKIVLVLSNPMASSEANGSKSLNLSFTSQMFPYSSRADNRLLQRR